MNVTLAGGTIAVYMLASLRILSWMVLAPPFSNRAVPVMAKVIISMALAMLVGPELMKNPLPASNAGLAGIFLAQVLLGGILGFLTMLLFKSVAVAGQLIDQFSGMTLSQAFDPLSMNNNSVFGRLHDWLMVALLFASGAHLLVIGGLLKTFELVPLDAKFSADTQVLEVLTSAFKLFVVTSVQLALPLIAVLFVVDLGLALMTKVAPQLNGMTVMFPAKIGLTLLLIGLTFPVLGTAVGRLTDLLLNAMSAVGGGG